jgi:hypothetical protein
MEQRETDPKSLGEFLGVLGDCASLCDSLTLSHDEFLAVDKIAARVLTSVDPSERETLSYLGYAVYRDTFISEDGAEMLEEDVLRTVNIQDLMDLLVVLFVGMAEMRDSFGARDITVTQNDLKQIQKVASVVRQFLTGKSLKRLEDTMSKLE